MREDATLDDNSGYYASIDSATAIFLRALGVSAPTILGMVEVEWRSRCLGPRVPANRRDKNPRPFSTRTAQARQPVPSSVVPG